MLSLEGKIAVITGGTSGIGARTAALFVEEGARVVIAGRRRERGEQLARALGECARFVPTDVAVEADVKAMIGHAMTWFGRIDCLVNNAGTGSQWVGIAEVDPDRFDAAIAVHVRGTLAAMKRAVPIMAAQWIGKHHHGSERQRGARRAGRALLLGGKGCRHSFDALCRGRTGRKGHPNQHDFAWTDRHWHFWQGRRPRRTRP